MHIFSYYMQMYIYNSTQKNKGMTHILVIIKLIF